MRLVAIENGLGIEQHEVAHSGVIQVLVDGQPIRSLSDIAVLRARLIQQQEYYRSQGRFQNNDDRQRFVELFEQAIAVLDR